MGALTDGAAKSTPDLQKLAGMSQRVLIVTRLTSRSGHEQAVITGAKGYNVDQILAIQNTLAASSGAGTYHFTVFEEGGVDKVEWTVKLGAGPDIPQQEGLMGFPIPGDASPGSGSGSRDLGHGFRYDAELGILLTPQKQAIPWRPGEPWPLGAGVAAAAPPWGGAATPVPGQQWGGYPVEDETKRELREMKAAFAARDREDARKAEVSRLEKAIEAQGAALAAALAKMSERPAGPSPTEVALAAQVEELKRQAEASRREDALRAEMKLAADASAAQMRELREALRDRPDPMLPLLTQIMQSQQASSTAALSAVQAATQAQADTAKENSRSLADRFASSIMTPERVEALLKIAKDQGPNDLMNKGILDMYKTLFGMSQDVLRQQAEVYSQAGGPAWVAPVQQGLEQLGTIAKAYAQSRGQAEGAAEVEKQRTERIKAEAARAEAAARAAQAQTQARAAAGQPRAQSPAAQRDAAARAAFGEQPKAAPANGAAGVKQAPAPAPAPAPTPPAAPQEVDLAKAPPAAVKEIIDAFDDATFFGPFHSQVLKLRAADLKPPDAANAVLAARSYFVGFGELPPAIELLQAGHIDLLVERLFPEGSDIYRRGVADAIRVELRAEASGSAGDGADAG